MADAQRPGSRAICCASSPWRDLNQMRSWSTRLIRAIGTRNSSAARAVMWSNDPSGGVSRIEYRRSAWSRSASFSGTRAFMMRLPKSELLKYAPPVRQARTANRPERADGTPLIEYASSTATFRAGPRLDRMGRSRSRARAPARGEPPRPRGRGRGARMNLAETQRLLWDLLHGRERPLDAFVGSPDLPAADRVGASVVRQWRRIAGERRYRSEMNRSVTNFARPRILSTRDRRRVASWPAGRRLISRTDARPTGSSGRRCLQREIDMNRRNLLAFSSLIIVATLSTLPAAAQAAPHTRAQVCAIGASGVGGQGTLICKDVLTGDTTQSLPLGATVSAAGGIGGSLSSRGQRVLVTN